MTGLVQRSLLLGALLLLLACSGKPGAVLPPAEEAPVRAYPIFVVSHGWHTGIIVPGPVLNEALAELPRHFGTPDYYEIGWGDTGFYQAQDITVALALQALFWSRGAVLHLVAFSGKAQHYFEGEPLYATCLSAQELGALQRYLYLQFFPEWYRACRTAAAGALRRERILYGHGPLPPVQHLQYMDGQGAAQRGSGYCPLFQADGGKRDGFS